MRVRALYTLSLSMGITHYVHMHQQACIPTYHTTPSINTHMHTHTHTHTHTYTHTHTCAHVNV